MLALLRRFFRVLLLIAGFILVALFIWFAGPLFEFAEYRPLDSANVRLAVIGVVVGLWFLWRVIKRLRAFKMSDALAAAVLKQSTPDRAQTSAEVSKLRERFEEALATLKQQRTRGHSLYELPWYVIIGAPGSGKTTALINSGLRFPLEPRGGRALRGVGGTRNCDWWFADEAVFLDTAGRYTTQDSDAASDAEGWAEFLALLRKYRKRRPINGVILTISAQDLMVQGEARREEHVEAARRRLIELNKELRIQLPVYLMVTKVDLVAGFAEYFDDLSLEGRAQVWGVTFPYDRTLSGDAANLFAGEFEALMERLNQRVAARVEEDRDVRRRTRIFAFPQQIAALSEPLTAFVSDVFGSSRFERQVLLRGVYLTSGTQEGTPIDRLLGAMGRGFGLSAEAVAPTGRGKAYFVERLLKEVLIGESGLAGIDTKAEVAKAAVHLAAYAAVAVLATLGVVALTISYNRNQEYLRRVAADLATFEKVPAIAANAPPGRLLARLDAVSTLTDAANQHRGRVPWGMRWGLYQGNALGNAARDAYMRELDSLLLPHVASRLRQRVVDRQADPEQLYEALKAYLMLNDTQHLDRGFLEQRAAAELAPAGAASTAPTLATHFKNRLTGGDALPPLVLDANLIAQSRRAIQKTSVARIIYRGIQRHYADDAARAVSLEQAAGGGVIRRKSGISLTQPMPAVYSKSVFNDVTDLGSSLTMVKQFATDDWVMGDAGPSVMESGALTNDVILMYERDYIDAWDRWLADLDLASSLRSPVEITAVLESLGGAGSPLRRIVSTVIENTRFSAAGSPALQTGAVATIREQIGRVTKPLQQATGFRSVVPGRLITAHFQPYHRLLDGEPGQTPLDRIIGLIGQVHLAWDNVGGDMTKASADPTLRAAFTTLRQEQDVLPLPLRSLVARLSGGAVTTIDVETGRIKAEEAGIIERAKEERVATIRSLFREQVLPECRRIVEGRYPFTPGSDQDLPLVDFASLFGPGGVFDSFFQSHLKGLADTSGTPWKWIPGQDTQGLPPQMLQVFQDAAGLRDVFFPGGAKFPGMQFTAMLLDFDSAATRFQLDIDGAVIDSQQPRRTYSIRWPGTRSGLVQANFDGRFAVQYSESYHGPWAWFKLLERSRIVRESDIRNVVTINVKGLVARVVIEALTVRNPFAGGEWQRFTCGS